jgi:hypothetical protein
LFWYRRRKKGIYCQARLTVDLLFVRARGTRYFVLECFVN